MATTKKKPKKKPKKRTPPKTGYFGIIGDDEFTYQTKVHKTKEAIMLEILDDTACEVLMDPKLKKKKAYVMKTELVEELELKPRKGYAPESIVQYRTKKVK